MISEKHQRIVEFVKDFSKDLVAPLAKEVDENHRFPKETVEAMAHSHMMGIPFKKELGGAGADTLAYVLTVEELSKSCATTGIILSAHTSLVCDPINTYGTKEQKEKYLVDLLSGKTLGAFGLTEANAGTDVAAGSTIAIKRNGYYEVSGNKIFITNAIEADTYLIFANTENGLTALIIEKGWDGFTFGPREKKLGICGSSTAELIFNHVRVPFENMLGKEGQGFKIAMKTLDGGRIGVAAQALGIAKGAFDEALKYSKERKQFGKTLSQFQNTQFVLADMKTQIDAASLLVYRAAQLKDENKRFSTEAAMAKLYASEVAMNVTTKAVQIHGGYGYIKDYPVERMMRDAKITEIYEGTSEVQRMVIASSLLR
ncbi:MAG: acyl-CoA dehydrogenase [Erysipelothrix sp.]|nr:acyl-CoA dehydrogenase [Erysipelothrix sp.]